MAEHWRTGQEDNRIAKVILEMGCITRLSQLRELHQRLPLQVFLVRGGIALQKLLGDGLHHAVEWIG